MRVLSDAEFAQKAKEYIGDADVEIHREEQRLKLQKKNSEDDEMFVSLQSRVEEEPLPTVWLPKDEYAKLSHAIHTNGRYENGIVGSEFTPRQ